MDIDTDMDIERAPCYVTQISTELLFHIINYLPLDAHFSFAITCKRTYACSADVLKRHQEASSKYRVLSDRDPTTVPSLLRSIFGDRDLFSAFHVRSFEVWFDRQGWEDWRVLDDEHGCEGEEQKAWEYIEDEWDDFIELLAYDNGTSEDYELARSQIEAGHDGILKAVLVANCPRLTDLKFESVGSDRVFETSYTLNWLELFIGKALHEENPWPPGLKNLKNIAVGVGLNEEPPWVRIIPEDLQDVPIGSNTDLLAHLFRLPSIESINFGHYRPDPGNPHHYLDMLPASCSSVKHIYLHSVWEMDPLFCEALAGAPKNLLSVCFSAGSGQGTLKHADLVVDGLSRHQGDSLESLMFYGYESHALSATPIAKKPFRPEILQDFKVLRHVSFDVNRIQLEARDRDRVRGINESDASFPHDFFNNCFPESMETFSLWNPPRFGPNFWEFNDEVDLENAIIELMTSGRFKNLKSVFLQELERPRYDEWFRPHSEKIWFQNAVKIGAENGIDVDTITNRNAKLHKFDLPKALDKYDFRTGPWGKRPADWEFDVHHGKWSPRGCGKCGHCEECLSKYTKQLWDSITDA